MAAGAAISDIVESWRPKFILVSGIAGGVSTKDDLQLGDVVVPDFVHYSEIQKIMEDGVQARHIPYDHPAVYLHESHVQPAMSEGTWQTRILELYRRWPAPKVVVGSLIATEKLWGAPSSEEQKRLFQQFSDAVAVDMESMGVGRGVFMSRRNLDYNCQYLVIRGISDFVDRAENDSTRKEWRPVAAHNAAAFAKCIADRLVSMDSRIGGVR